MIVLVIFAIIAILYQVSKTFNIKIEIENLKINLPSINKQFINKQSKIKLKIYLLKIKIKEIDLKNIKIDNEKVKNRLDKIKQKMNQKSKLKNNINVIKILREDNYKVEKLDLNIFVGTEDAAITAFGVGIISLLMGNILRTKITDTKKQKYKIIPIYQNKNVLKVNFDGIFSLNLTNIIDILRILRKGRVKEYDRTSNRRSYAYSNE